MSDNRNTYGQFENNSMGSEAEQFRAGVNANDTELSASNKVHNARIDAINKQYSQANNPFHHEASVIVASIRRAQRPYYFAVIAALGLIVWAWWSSAIPNYHLKIAYTDTPPYATRDKQILNTLRISSIKNIEYLFKEGAPLAAAFSSCAARPCVNLDLRALDSLRAWAADTTTPWDEQVCRYFTLGYSAREIDYKPSHLGIEATYRLDRSKGQCILTSYGQIKKRTDLLNNIRHGLGLFLVIGSIFWYKRKLKEVEKRYSSKRQA